MDATVDSAYILLLSVALRAEPEGFHFGSANGRGVAVWSNVAAAADHADDVTDDVTDDVDAIALGFMTWQSNATLLHYRNDDTRQTLDVTLASRSSCIRPRLLIIAAIVCSHPSRDYCRPLLYDFLVRSLGC